MNKKRLIILFIITFIIAISPFSVLADKKDDEIKVYCPLCIHRNDKDPMFAKERQFYQKVKILKKAYGDAIDEVVLAASVIHRYTGPDIAYEREYTENFDSREYSNRSKLLTQSGLSPEEEEAVSQNEKYDLLTLAALVMADSNAGKYSDVCFKEGLSGNSLVGNVQKSSGIISRAIMPLIQNVTCAVTMLSGTDSYFGDNKNVAQITEALRRENVYNVCNHGYVGGLYNGVKNIPNEETRNAQKKVIAQQIIDYANYYKRLYGVLDEAETCADNSAGATGAYANWKQTDSKWSNVMIGDEPDENVGKYGCLVTSMAIQISRSGSKIGSLPSGSNEFDPGSFAKSLKENNGFDNGGSFLGNGYQSIAPNFHIVGDTAVNISDSAQLASVIGNELLSGYQDKYQKFIILGIRYVDNSGYASSQHWVAVNSVDNDKVTIYDPARNGNTLDQNYKTWTVFAYKVMYADDVEQGKIGSSNSSNCNSGGNDLNRFIGFLAYYEGHETCNYNGQGDGTGYRASTLANDPGGQTTAFGITGFNKQVADEIGYTSFYSDLSSGCTKKEDTERLLVAIIDSMENHTKKQMPEGMNLKQHQIYALASVNYGGVVLAVPIINAIQTYGEDSEQVYRAFQNSFTNMFYADALERRRMGEYEMFMTQNYENEPAQYLGWSGMYQKAISMSKEETMSKWPTKRTELLEGMEFAPIDGTSVSLSNGKNCELECNRGNAKCKGDNKGSSGGGLSGVVECVHNQLGKPYVFGDEGPDTFDCSGLSKYCYKQGLGVDLYHQSGVQYYDSRFVNVGSEAELVPGDLLVNLGHVAIYIGDGKMIHAPQPGDVVREGTVEGFISLGNSPVLRHYVG